MSTLDRLRQLGRPSEANAPSSAPKRKPRELTYEQLDRNGQPLPERRELPSLPGAAVIDTPAGPCIVIDRTFEAESSHGRLAVEESTVSASDVIAFCEREV